ncbi:MAG TPA: NAD(P)/FAD-dependent oxidoreductase [Nocardioidaceae bacterium]|nr:NAD(P)/FAD-dependent oxidoreductase [Nocardioidaceae bacterium]
MSESTYDVIVIGARCAGSSTAMLLARQGHRVLVVDRATFPSDTMSTHLVHPPAVAALRRWGLLDDVLATGCPPVDTYAFDFGPFTIAGAPGTDAEPVAYAPRRTVLDQILVDAARKAGAEVREGFAVTDIVVEDGRVSGVSGRVKGGATVTERAAIVVGADGLHSTLARAVSPEQYAEKPKLLAGYYAYWSDLPMDGRFEAYIRHERAFAAWPTNDDLTVVIGGWPYRDFEANKADLERHYLAMFDQAPSFADRLRKATRETRLVGAAVPNFFRKPYGPGWVLVGDSGYNKDFITAMGIHDAFRDAESVAEGLHQVLAGTRSFDAAMADYQSARDQAVMPMYELTAELASLEPPPPELEKLLQAVHGNQAAMDEFSRVNAAVMSPADFFAEDNVARIFAAAG